MVRWVHVEGRIDGCGPCLNSFFVLSSFLSSFLEYGVGNVETLNFGM